MEYIKCNKLKSEVYNQINHVRLYKKVVLPIELVRNQSRVVTEYFKTLEAESLIEWKFQFLETLKPIAKLRKVWKGFKD